MRQQGQLPRSLRFPRGRGDPYRRPSHFTRCTYGNRPGPTLRLRHKLRRYRKPNCRTGAEGTVDV